MYCDLWCQYIKVRKLFRGGNYSRAKTIRGNTVGSHELQKALDTMVRNVFEVNFESNCCIIYISM